MTCYALGQKLVPGLHIDGVINLDQTGAFPRLQEPLGYWNALALFLVLGVPSTLALTVDERRSRRWRTAAVVALSMMLVAIGLTYSRGGLIALVVALAVTIGLGGVRLRALMWLAAAALAAIPSLIVGADGPFLDHRADPAEQSRVVGPRPLGGPGRVPGGTDSERRPRCRRSRPVMRLARRRPNESPGSSSPASWFCSSPVSWPSRFPRAV